MLLDSEVARREFLQLISDNLPGSEEFVAVIVPIVTHNIRTLVDFKGPLAIISLIGMLWSATGVYAAIGRAVDRATRQGIVGYLVARVRERKRDLSG